MKKSKFWVSTILGIALLILPGILLSQNNTENNNNYEPKPGQAGKDVIWYPTPQELVDVMIDMAELTSKDYLIDLGSGDGRIVIAAAKKGIRAAGIEYNPDMVEFSKKNAEKEGVADKTDFIKADFYEYDLSKATVITMFLLPEINRKLKPKLLELKPGTRIITNTFSMQDWAYDEMEEVDDDAITWNTAYLWIVPAKVEGMWKIAEGDLELSQNYQIVSGNLIKNGNSYMISAGKLRGDILSFSCEGINYECTVSGNKMNGTAEKDGNKSEWSATKLQ